jgi:hypothetical protein
MGGWSLTTIELRDSNQFQLLIDRGVRHVTDILKAVALGVTAGAYPKHMDAKQEGLDIQCLPKLFSPT